MNEIHVPSKDEILEAADQLRQIVSKTPLIPFQAIEQRLNAKAVKIKAESIKLTGSFNFRGALWKCKQLTEAEQKNGVISYSSGNFAQGLAAAASKLGIPATIVMPIDAPKLKRKRAKAYGADVVLSDHGSHPREEVAREKARILAKEKKMTLLHPYDDPLLITGHASVAVEVVEELISTGESLPDIVLYGVGGGGLTAGLILGFHYLAPEVELVVVESEGYDGLGSSIANNQITRIPRDKTTICYALYAKAPGKSPFACTPFTDYQSRLTVKDHSVIQAMQFAFENLKMVLDPSEAAAIAAMLEYPDIFNGKRIVAFTTVGSITIQDFAKILSIYG